MRSASSLTKCTNSILTLVDLPYANVTGGGTKNQSQALIPQIDSFVAGACWLQGRVHAGIGRDDGSNHLGEKHSSGWLIGSLCVISMGFKPELAVPGTGVVPKILPRPSLKVVVFGRVVTPSAMVHTPRHA